MANFLLDIGTQPSRIFRLYDSYATRNPIAQTLAAMADDPNILPGDPIVIYYSGHGGQTLAPPGWPAGNGIIQVIAPFDYSDAILPGTSDAISDIGIGCCLNRLAENKGDNIVRLVVSLQPLVH